MSLPSWMDKKYGSMVRAALWLEQEVGEGNIFRKSTLREAFPEVTQIDRRVRDLRAHDWQIDTSREDPSLKQDEQRYARKGREVWRPGQMKADSRLNAAQRMQVLQADSFLCRSCGIAAGDRYDDGVDTAHLDLTHREVRAAEGDPQAQFVTACQRCRVGVRGASVDVPAFLARVEALSLYEQDVFVRWVEADRRRFSELEKLWGLYRSFPGETRVMVEQALPGMRGGDQEGTG